MDIIVTTPKSRMKDAAAEAADCIAAGGGQYFRRFPPHHHPVIASGCRVYYVEDGYLRGFAIVSRVEQFDVAVQCSTTGQIWAPGFYVFMDARTWKWVRPIPMKGFQGFRYAVPYNFPADTRIEIVGDWFDPKPEAPR